MTSLTDLQQQTAHNRRSIDLNYQQQVQTRNGSKRKREELEQWMRKEVTEMKATLDEMQSTMDLLAPGLYDDDIANLTATISTLVDSVQGMKKEGMLALADLAASTDDRLKTINKLLDAHNAPRGMEKRIADQDLRMDKLQGDIARLARGE